MNIYAANYYCDVDKSSFEKNKKIKDMHEDSIMIVGS